MKLTDRLYKSVEEIWNSYLEHPFVKGIGDGSLDVDKFRFYMVQDYIYLLDYSKVFALGVVKSDSEEYMRFFADLVHGTLNGEMKIHKAYMERLGIKKEEVEKAKMSLTNVSYTNYMLWVGNNYGLLELLVAILSCAWSYQMIGKELAKKDPNSVNHEFYGEWIQGYASEEFSGGNEPIFEMINKLGENCTAEQEERLTEIFINCSRHEYKFWDMAFNKEM